MFGSTKAFLFSLKKHNNQFLQETIMCFSQIYCTEKIRRPLPREMGRTNHVVNTGRLLQRETHPPCHLDERKPGSEGCLLGSTMRTRLQPQPLGGRGETATSGKGCGSNMALFSQPPSVMFLNPRLSCQGLGCHACSPRTGLGNGPWLNRTRIQDRKKHYKTFSSSCL